MLFLRINVYFVIFSPRAKFKVIKKQPYALFQMITPETTKFSQTIWFFSSVPVDRLIIHECREDNNTITTRVK